MPRIRVKGVDLFLHQQGLDTSTTAGKAMFQMLGVFAEFERGIIQKKSMLVRIVASGEREDPPHEVAQSQPSLPL